MNKKSRGYFFCIIFLLPVLLPVSCGKASYRDGVYSGRSGEDDTGAWGEVRLTIAEGRVADCSFVTWQKDGTVKDEDYGKINGEISNRIYYQKAQLAVEAMGKYAADYVKAAGDIKAIEAVSGATIAYNQFIEAVEDALEEAGK
ncbi:MAG: FMN-binding protein [Spirochaetaceae bacterium]|jgi:major membrane immunogen (membrane-anchored lipoprotein)|nr:FMN-binding protein [Spirochaetaceae bacterium]